MTRSPHPGVLTLSYFCIDVYARISVQPTDPFELVIDIKPKGNIDHILSRTTQRTVGRATSVNYIMPTRPQLWLGRCALHLDPHNIQPAREWCERYAAWLRDGDLSATAAGQVAA